MLLLQSCKYLTLSNSTYMYAVRARMRLFQHQR